MNYYLLFGIIVLFIFTCRCLHGALYYDRVGPTSSDRAFNGWYDYELAICRDALKRLSRTVS